MIMLFIYFLCFFISVKGDTIYNMYINGFASTFKEYMQPEAFSCNILSETRRSPFVVILLYQSSGHFLGMGGILDRTTVITSEAVLELAGKKVDNILVLAGYFSPWWGENAQVRRATSTHISDFEVVLVEINPRWKFTPEIRPLRVLAVPYNADTEYTLYGVRTSDNFHNGDPVGKTATYYPSKYEPTPFDNCTKDYPRLEAKIDTKTHACFTVNDSCRGCLGSPVARVRRSTTVPMLLGVIIRVACKEQQVLMVKNSAFEDWVKYKINIEDRQDYMAED